MSSGIRLRTPRLLLRPFGVGDLDDLHAYRRRPDVVRYLYDGVLDRRGAADLLRRRMVMDRLVEPGDSIVLAAELGARVVGDVSLHWTSAEHRQGEVGFVFHPDVHGRGLAREAATALLDLALGPVGLHRVSGRCDARNTASAGLMQRLGMRQEAHLVHNEWFKGAWGDELVFAVLDDEWRELRSSTMAPRGATARPAATPSPALPATPTS